MKWYNALKRYGFVELSDGSGDAFLHTSALAGISVDALQPGVTIEFRTAPAQRGPQVTEVISVDSSTAAPPRPPRKSQSASPAASNTSTGLRNRSMMEERQKVTIPASCETPR